MIAWRYAELWRSAGVLKTSMRYKIQMWTASGWADVKSSTDGGEYEVDLYSDIHDALSEAADLRELGHTCLVQSEYAHAECDIYE